MVNFTNTSPIKSKLSNNTLTKADNQKKLKNDLKIGKKDEMVDKKGSMSPYSSSSENSMVFKDVTPQIDQMKPPLRPKVCQKKFLDPVMSILSKSTAGIQYPDVDPAKKKERRRYRSTILNLEDEVDTNFDVIQQKKDIFHTPSVCSSDSGEDFKSWELGLPRLIQPDEEELRLKREQNISQLVKEVTEGRMQKEKVTPDISDNKGLYNFFVDLLETTLSAYNVKDDVNNVPSNQSSRLAFEIDESVAKKLQVSQKTCDDVLQEPSERFYCEPTGDLWKPGTEVYKTDTRQKPQPKPKKRMKSTSFDRLRRSQRNQNAVVRRKKFDRNAQKENLLSLLKEQLSLDFNPFEEPPNLFQSLQVMAEHQRKCQKSLRFDRSTKFDDGYIEYCRRRKTKEQRREQSSEYKRRSQVESSEEGGSIHSLKVYGIDYQYLNRPERERKLLFTYHSSSESEFD